MNDIAFREWFYHTTKRLQGIVHRKKSKPVNPVKSELDWLNRMLEEKGSKPLYGSTYEKVYQNYKEYLESQLQ